MRHENLPCLFVEIDDLPPLVRPANVYRENGMTLLWVHPGTPKSEIAMWVRENLTLAERRVLRVAYEMSDPDPQTPIEATDPLLEGCADYRRDVPAILRLPRPDVSPLAGSTVA